MWFGPLAWYLIVSIIGAVTFPIAYQFFPALQDRGYSFSRALGLLLWGYLFWLLSSLQALPNTIGGYLFAFLALLAGSYWFYRKIGPDELLSWISTRRKALITTEVVFAAAFVFLLVLRGMDPAVLATEKPMELAFINAILRSPTMPPLDPWLADYSISYYYFGYVMVAMLAKMSGVSGGVAFNLGISLVFALGAVGAYGLVYNLLAATGRGEKKNNTLLALLGPLFVFFISNVEGFLEFLHGRGVFWQQSADGTWVSNFWTNLKIEDLVLPPPGNTAPGALRHWWWWRASRVVGDFDLNGNRWEVIDEFPFFSFLLGDLHPHVLVIPFVFLALALALNLFLSGHTAGKRFRIFRFKFLFSAETFLLGGIVFGALGFLNTWDFPWYVGVFAGAHLLRKIVDEGWHIDHLYEFFILGISFGITGLVLYLPFYISFSSQAGGILPNVITPTRGAHLWVMFGTLFVPIFSFLGYLLFKEGRQKKLIQGFSLVAVGVLFLFGFSYFLTITLGRSVPGVSNMFLGIYNVEDVSVIIQEGISRRLAAWGGLITLVLLLSGAFALLWPQKIKREEEIEGEVLILEERHPVQAHQFAVLLVVFGGLLVLVPEFIYLRDLFLHRMNTIFKFYYQAWLMWGIAAAYGSALLLSQRKNRLLSGLFLLVFVAVVFVGLVYPAMGLNSRWASFQASQEGLKLDGTENHYYLNPDEKAAAAWLSQVSTGTLVEAVGGSYSQYARISTNTGQPALLGWVGHEGQWRGGGVDLATRQNNVQQLYSTPFWEQAVIILRMYDVRYVVVGNLERSTYQVNEQKFADNLNVAFQLGSITIYETPGWED